MAGLLAQAVPRDRAVAPGGPGRPRDCRHDKTALATDIRLPIPRMARRQLALEVRILGRCPRIGPEIVPKREVLAPEAAAELHQMKVIGTGLTPAKELMPEDARISAVLVAGPLERRNAGEGRDRRRVARQNVQDRLGAQARYGGAADVLERQLQLRGGSQNAGCLGLKER